MVKGIDFAYSKITEGVCFYCIYKRIIVLNINQISNESKAPLSITHQKSPTTKVIGLLSTCLNCDFFDLFDCYDNYTITNR
jgi:hypothetical protein